LGKSRDAKYKIEVSNISKQDDDKSRYSSIATYALNVLAIGHLK
jgi:hypothetical protein